MTYWPIAQKTKHSIASGSYPSYHHTNRYRITLRPLKECHMTQAQYANAAIQRMTLVLHGSEFLPHHVYFTSVLFREMHKYERRLQVVNDVLYPKFCNNVGHKTYKQIVVLADTMDSIIKTLQKTPCRDTLTHPKCFTNYARKISHSMWPRMYITLSTTATCAFERNCVIIKTGKNHLNKSMTRRTNPKTSL